MNRKQFLRRIKREFRGVPQNEIKALSEYFDESISERMDRGMSEAEAVAALGSPEEAASRIIEEMPVEFRKNVKKESGFIRGAKITMIVLGSPVWLSVLIAVFAVLLALAAVYVSTVITLFVAAAATAISAVGSIVLMFITDNLGVLMGLGAASICAGLAVLFVICGVLSMRLVGRMFTVRIRRRAIA